MTSDMAERYRFVFKLRQTQCGWVHNWCYNIGPSVADYRYIMLRKGRAFIQGAGSFKLKQGRRSVLNDGFSFSEGYYSTV